MRDGFIQAEYFEFAGGEYISTKFKPNSNTKIVVDCQVVSLSSQYSAICGSRNKSSQQVWFYVDNSKNIWMGRWGTKEYSISFSSQPVSDRHVVSLDKSQFKVDGTTIAINDSTSFTNSYSMHIGDVNNANSPQYPCKVRIFSMQVYDNGTLVRDFIPCLEESSEHIGLYDRATDIFHRANGSQTSTLSINKPIIGNIKTNGGLNPLAGGYVNINGSYKPITQAYMFKKERYCVLDYIQSTGMQGIDTGIAPSDDLVTTINFQFLTDITSHMFIFGAGHNSIGYLLDAKSGNTLRWSYGGKMSSTTIDPAIAISASCSKSGITINGTTYAITPTKPNTTDNIYIFTTYTYANKGMTNNNGVFNFYSFKMIKDGITIRNYIPVMRVSDKMIGLLETCEKKFYSNDISKKDKIPYSKRSCIETTYPDSDNNTNAKWVYNNTSNYAANAKLSMNSSGVLSGVANILEAHDASDANKFAKYNYDYGYSEPHKNLLASDCTLVSIKITNSSGTEITSSNPSISVDDNHIMHFSVISTALVSATAGMYTLTITVSRSSISCKFEIPITKIDVASRYFISGPISSTNYDYTNLKEMCDIRTITCNAFTAESLVPTWTITSKAPGASYGFNLASDGYYTSSNNGVNNSASVCRVNFTNNTGAAYTVKFNCINYAESTFDYGIIGKINTALDTSNTSDSTYTKSFSGSQSSSVQTVTLSVPTGTSWVDVKYRKDGSQHHNNDSLKFKITT